MMMARTHAPRPMRRRVLTVRAVRHACTFAAVTAAASLMPTLVFAQPVTEPPETVPVTPAAPAPEPPQATPLPSVNEAPLTMSVPEPPCSPKKDESSSDRTLGNHVFIFPTEVTSSLVTTYVGLRLRLGSNSVTNLPTVAGITSIEAVTFAEGLDLGIKVTDWLGIFVTGGVSTLVGTNLRALTYAGATYELGGSGGAVLRLLRIDRTGTQLSFRAHGAYARGQVSTLFPIFDRPVASLVDALQGDLGESIRTPTTRLSGTGAFAFTQGFGKFFGLQASAALGVGRVEIEPYDRVARVRTTQTDSELTYAFGAAPSFDFDAFSVPIAVMPEYVLSRQAHTAEVRGAGTFDTQHTLALGAYYSGRVNLQIGVIGKVVLGTNGLTTAQGTSETPKTTFGELILRYVW